MQHVANDLPYITSTKCKVLQYVYMLLFGYTELIEWCTLYLKKTCQLWQAVVSTGTG